MSRSPVPSQTPEQFLAALPPEVRATAEALRRLVKGTLPGVQEAVYPGWQLIGYRVPDGRRTVQEAVYPGWQPIGYRVPDGRRTVYVAFVFPQASRVVLGFEWGVLVAGEFGLLGGDGRQVRQVAFPPGAEIRPEPLATLIRRAAGAALLPKARKRRC